PASRSALAPGRRVPLNRALSKIGALSRALATQAIHDGRVTIGGRVVRDPLHPVVPERSRIALDGVAVVRDAWRRIRLHKPRGRGPTSRDPNGRRTIYDVLGEAGRGLIAVGRLDLATSGLLILTNDTQLADRITDPRRGIARVYLATVRGEVTPEEAAAL